MAISDQLNCANGRERRHEASRGRALGAPLCFGGARDARCAGPMAKPWNVRDADATREASSSSEESFRLIVETLPGLIAVMTADGGVEHVNRQVLDYFGRTLEELRQWGTTD